MAILLREGDVRSLLTMQDTLAALEGAFVEAAAGRAQNQPRRRVRAGDVVLATMSAALPYRGLVGYKAYTHGPGFNRFWVHIFDAAEGRPRAVIEADWLGRMRTGAASGIATRHLARKDAAILTVIGAGTQALTQVLAVATVRQLDEVRLISRNAQRRRQLLDALQRELPSPPPTLRDMPLAPEALAGAHVVTTITSAGTPLFPGDWLEPGQHVNACGSNVPNRRELDACAIERADLIVADDAEAARVEAGDLLLAEQEGKLDWARVSSLRDVVAGRTVRRDPKQLTLFKSVGLALEDVAVAATIIERAETRGLGEPLPL